MSLFEWRITNNIGNSCPSCLALRGQIHSGEEWDKAGLYPRCKLLLCYLSCECELVEVFDVEESGDLSLVPLRKSKEVKLQAQVSGVVNGDFEIVLITAGVGNGWEFSRDVLQKSLPLWSGAHVFVDHDWNGGPRSVRDLCGVIFDPSFDDFNNGVVGKVKAQGVSGDLLRSVGREWLTSDHKADVGFSADVIFTVDGTRVVEILRVMSVDLVFDPARGGLFIRALNQRRESGEKLEANMSDDVTNGAAAASSAVTGELKATRELLGVVQEQAKLKKEVEDVQKVRIEMCSYLLQSGLAASGLPAPMQENVRVQFEGKAFEAADLNKAIDAARKLTADLTAGQVVQGVGGRVHQMFSSEDQLQAAIDDMLEAPRNVGAETLKVAKLSGVREAYLGFTGDYDFHGAINMERRMFGTGTFTNLVVNAMNKSLVNRWNQLGREGYNWWEKIAHIEQFSDLKQITWLIFGTVASLPSIAKGAEYTPLMIGDGKENSSFTKYGGYVGVDLEDMINDDTRKLRQIPRETANAGLRGISSLCAAIFTDASGTGPTMADTGVLFNNTAVTTVGGHANLLTTALGTDYTAWDAAAQEVYNQPMLVANSVGYYGTGKKMAIDPKFCLVPRALKAQAEALFMPRWASVVDVVATKGGPSFGGVVEPVVVPEWTDATDWASVVDPKIAAGVCIGHAFGLVPEIFVAGDELSPAVFMNDEARIKVRHWIAVGVADFRSLHKNNVA